MILDALIAKEASQPVAEMSEWLRDHFGFAVPSLAPADPGAGSWLQRCWQSLFGVGVLRSLLAGIPMVTPQDPGALPCVSGCGVAGWR